jgi:hypothetical protein
MSVFDGPFGFCGMTGDEPMEDEARLKRGKCARLYIGVELHHKDRDRLIAFYFCGTIYLIFLQSYR